MENNKWENGPCGNLMLKRDGYHISYNEDPSASLIGFGGFFDLFGDNTKEETALCFNDNYLILNGDFRREYERCQSLGEAMAVYNKLKSKYGSEWSA